MTPAPDNRLYHPRRDSRTSASLAIQPMMVSIAITLSLVVLWLFMHRYLGLVRDGELYALQAVARINPSLAVDVYLENTSQDRYTIFSRIYQVFIQYLGLQNGGLLLFVVCTVGFLVAAWVLARELFGSDKAWLAVALIISTIGSYGAYGIFHYAETYLTARSMAEFLIVTALAAHFCGYRRLGLGIAATAMFIHPLMALPGVLLLICLWLPIRLALLCVVAGIFGIVCIAILEAMAPVGAQLLPIIDPSWLEVVRERSQFLFLNYWHLSDWEMHARPFLCLAISATVLDDERIRRLCVGAMLVGAAGLMVAFVAGAIGPVAIFVQGQAWRWFWITGFASVLLLAPTAIRIWRDAACGPICATLIISAWTFPPVHGTALAALALLIWSLRSRIDLRSGCYLRWGGFALIAVILTWILANSWSLVTSPPAESGGESELFDRIRSVLGLQISAILFFTLFWYWIRRNRSIWPPTLIALFVATFLRLLVPWSFSPIGMAGSREEIQNFLEWRSAIPSTSNVLLLPSTKSAAFVWFTLERPSYLSVDQSAGVVFSRATALEIRRRSNVLLPVMEPDWKILSQIRQQAPGKKPEEVTRPLTAKSLVAICGDPRLGFVIAKESVGFEPIRHNHAGAWKDWNLYDCRRVRSAAPAA